VIDDHSRVACAEICATRQPPPVIGVLERAVVWVADLGVIVERVLSDNGSAIDPSHGGTAAPHSASVTNELVPTGRRPTARL
jgi:hypothetical protein